MPGTVNRVIYVFLSNPVRWVLLSSPFHMWRSWGTGKLSNLVRAHSLKEAELGFQPKESDSSTWTSPLMVCAGMFSRLWLFAAPRTIAYLAPLSMGFPRQEYWEGLPCPPPGDLPNPGIKLVSLTPPTLVGGFFTTGTTWEVLLSWYSLLFLHHMSHNYNFIWNWMLNETFLLSWNGC